MSVRAGVSEGGETVPRSVTAGCYTLGMRDTDDSHDISR